MDPFNFSQPDPFHETDPGRIKISQNHGKFPPKSTKIIRISYIFFSKILNFCLTDINIYPINNKIDNFLEKYIFIRNKNEHRSKERKSSDIIHKLNKTKI